jgi:hypothetical protein
VRAVHLNGSGQFGTGLLCLSSLAIECFDACLPHQMGSGLVHESPSWTGKEMTALSPPPLKPCGPRRIKIKVCASRAPVTFANPGFWEGVLRLLFAHNDGANR